MNIHTLDYAPKEILMVADTQVELDKRIKACAKEIETIAFIESFPPASVFHDVGSNTGAYSLVAASLGHRTVAFEPVPWNYSRLAQNILLNQVDVCALPVALSDVTGIQGLVPSSFDTGSALHQWSIDGFPCLAYRLDDLLDVFELPEPDYMKVDVDGYELEVLRGAARTLKHVKGLLVEQDTESSNSMKVGPFLEGLGFRSDTGVRHGETNIWNVIYVKVT